MKTTEIAYVAYPGEDVQELLDFYSAALGLRLARKHPEEGPAKFIEFQVGPDSWFSVVPTSFFNRPAGSGVGVAFEVDDIDAAASAVRKHSGAIAGEISDSSGCRWATAEDPEGNHFLLHQAKHAH
jgi:predicted enzyme related to lactoylglutathione lyase